VKHGRRDANHAEIRDRLREAHISVWDTGDVGGGFPDLVAAGQHRKTFQEITVLFEVKTQDGKLTPDQVEFINSWRGTVHIVRTVEEALRVFGIEV
jgi:hypothetical protein